MGSQRHFHEASLVTVQQIQQSPIFICNELLIENFMTNIFVFSSQYGKIYYIFMDLWENESKALIQGFSQEVDRIF